MVLKHVLQFFIFLMIANFIIILPVVHMSLLFIARGDYIFLLGNFVLISLLTRVIPKIQLSKAAFIGLLISCLSLNLEYLCWYLGVFINPIYGFIVFYVTVSVLWFLMISKKIRLYSSTTNIALSGILLITPAFLSNSFPSLPEKRNSVFTEIRFNNYRDIKQSDDTVEISYLRHPLFGLREVQKLYKVLPNQNGILRVNLSGSFDIKIDLYKDDNMPHSYYISRTELQSKREFLFNVNK